MIPNLIKIGKQILGSSLLLPAYGRAGARATLLGGVFRETKYEKLRRRKARAGKKRRGPKRNTHGLIFWRRTSLSRRQIIYLSYVVKIDILNLL